MRSLRILGGFQVALDKENEQVAGAEGRREEQEQLIEAASGALESAKALVAARGEALQAASEEVVKAKGAVAQRLAEQLEGASRRRSGGSWGRRWRVPPAAGRQGAPGNGSQRELQGMDENDVAFKLQVLKVQGGESTFKQFEPGPWNIQEWGNTRKRPKEKDILDQNGIKRPKSAPTRGELGPRPALQLLAMDQSLKTTVPGVLSRSPSERGSFDGTAAWCYRPWPWRFEVIEELEKTLLAKIEELKAAAEGLKPAAEERQGAVEAAQKERNMVEYSCMVKVDVLRILLHHEYDTLHML